MGKAGTLRRPAHILWSKGEAVAYLDSQELIHGRGVVVPARMEHICDYANVHVDKHTLRTRHAPFCATPLSMNCTTECMQGH